MQKRTNRLTGETSPYLLQHAHNPVDWYPWGDHALDRAKKENKPIFLSIGYSSCHWCHVMAHESFENEEIAGLLNEKFICVKVDREERPDIDDIYMTAVTAMTGRGGWPLSVFLTPDLEPFFGGTYFPPEDKWGVTGFKRLIQALSSNWEDAVLRKKMIQDAEAVTRMLKEETGAGGSYSGSPRLDSDLLRNALGQIVDAYDSRWGGFGFAPKFPPSITISFLLRDYHFNGNKNSLAMAEMTLDKMSEGGMYDHLGGGFHRYSTDAMWRVPHFEKMLYDNALLAGVYLEAFQVTGKTRYARIAGEIFDYVLRDMTDEEGGFYSSEDADSEGEEGALYIWTLDEVKNVLDERKGALFAECYSLRDEGNFASPEPFHRGKNILYLTRPLSAVAKEKGMTEDELNALLEESRRLLLRLRRKRPHPSLDDKIVTSWNALMISSLAKGYQVLGDKRYLKAAEKAALFLRKKLYGNSGLLRTYRGGKGKIPAFLEDYASSIQAFIDMYEAEFDGEWVLLAGKWAEEMTARFWDDGTAGFYDTSELHENLIARRKSAHDGALPSPAAVAVLSLLRLSKLLNREGYFSMAVKVLEAHTALMDRIPRGYLSLIRCVDYVLHPPKEIAVAGKKESEEIGRMLEAVNSRYVPNRVLAFIDPDEPSSERLGKMIPLLAGKGMLDGKAAAYVCQDSACIKPVSSPEDLLQLLDGHK